MGAQGPPPEVARLLAQLETLELERGAIVGFLAHGLGYVVTLLVLLVAEDGYTTEWHFSETGQLLVNAMFVPIERQVTGGVAPGFEETQNLLTDPTLATSFALPTPLYHAIPVVALLIGGVVLAHWSGARTTADGFVAGLSLGVGGLLFAITATLLFTNDLGRPAFLETVVLVGLVYPVLCGATGGVLGTLTREWVGTVRSDHHD